MKQRVTYNEPHIHLSGVITGTHRIRVDGKLKTVYSVKWDGNPTSVPMTWRDEDGSSKRGYSKDRLVFL